MNAPARITTGITSATIKLPPPLSVNAAFANVPGKGRVKSGRYKTWAQAAISLAKGFLDGKATPIPQFTGPVSLAFYVPEKRSNGAKVKMDLDNGCKAYIDLLVQLGAIPDDGPKYVRAISLQWIDAKQGHVVITQVTR